MNVSFFCVFSFLLFSQMLFSSLKKTCSFESSMQSLQSSDQGEVLKALAFLGSSLDHQEKNQKHLRKRGLAAKLKPLLKSKNKNILRTAVEVLGAFSWKNRASKIELFRKKVIQELLERFQVLTQEAFLDEELIESYIKTLGVLIETYHKKTRRMVEPILREGLQRLRQKKERGPKRSSLEVTMEQVQKLFS